MIITGVAGKKHDPSKVKGELMLSNQDAMEVQYSLLLMTFSHM